MTRFSPRQGRFFDELEVGDIYEHRPGRTVSEADNVFFTTLTMNPQSLHLDAVYASKTEFGVPLVNSLFTLATVVGLSVADSDGRHHGRQSRFRVDQLSEPGLRG